MAPWLSKCLWIFHDNSLKIFGSSLSCRCSWVKFHCCGRLNSSSKRMPSFWESQYVQFVRAFPSAVRALFNLIMAIFPLKVIMSMEGSRLDARPPAQLWSKMRKHYRIADVRAVPTFRQVLESELTSSALKYLGWLWVVCFGRHEIQHGAHTFECYRRGNRHSFRLANSFMASPLVDSADQPAIPQRRCVFVGFSAVH